MSRTREETPDTWAEWGDKIQRAGADAYYTITDDQRPFDGSQVWVWHWHTPTQGSARWQASGCANHTVVQQEPLTLSPSLACADGCPWHGYIENGQWRSV